MAVATVDDVVVAIGRPLSSSAEEDQVGYWLDAVELMIGARLGAVADLDQDVLRYVEIEAVALKLSNPNGYQSETIDDYTYRFGSETRRVSILAEWWDLLTPSGAASAFTITPYGAPGRTEPDVWVPPTDHL